MLQSIAIALGTLLAARYIYSIAYKSWQKKKLVARASIDTDSKGKSDRVSELSRTATALTTYDFENVQPIPYRPFLNQGHLSIGAKKIVKEDWIQIDQLYLARVADRKRNLELYPEKCHGINNDEGARAISELFESIVKHLPERFPTMFERDATGDTFRNKATRRTYNLDHIRTEPRQMQKFLSENVEEDFYLMCPSEKGIYIQQAFLSCFSNGFLAPTKLGLSMRDIHGPVPGLEDKIGKSVDRLMGSMQGGSMIQRMGWSLQFSGPDLLRTGGNNFYPDPDQAFSDLSEPQDVGQCYLRVERQTLTRLPETRAIVFGIHHYVTPLDQIKKEGHGKKLVEEIKSMPEKLGYYKRRPFWQRDIEAFLTD